MDARLLHMTRREGELMGLEELLKNEDDASKQHLGFKVALAIL